MTVAFLDVDYREEGAVAACILADSLVSEMIVGQRAVFVDSVAPYEPGAFYKRELPCLRVVLAEVTRPLSLVVIDGYVWLDEGQPGLGVRLYEALGRIVPVLGIAKTCYRNGRAAPVLRGESHRPLYVGAIGVDLVEMVEQVRQMHGAHRIPEMVRCVDRLCRKVPIAAFSGDSLRSFAARLERILDELV